MIIFNNRKSLREIAKIIQRSNSTVRHVERYKKESRLTGRVRKSAKKVFATRDERWVLRQIETNTK